MRKTSIVIAALVVALLIAGAAFALLPGTASGPGDAASGDGASPTSGPPEPTAAGPLRDLPPIVFASNAPGSYELFATGPGGGDPVPLRGGPAMYPSWAPDGSALVYVGETTGQDAHAGDPGGTDPHGHPTAAGHRPELRRITTDGAVEPLFRGMQVPSHPSIRAGDRSVAFQSTLLQLAEVAGSTGLSSIEAFDPRDGRRRTLVEHRGAAYQPAWSPEGDQLAVVLGDPGCRSRRPCPQRLAVWSPETRTSRTVVRSGAAAAPAWSPDGATIAFTWDRGDGPSVWTLDVATGARERLTRGPGGDAEPTWSPDGTAIAYMRGCDIHLQRVAGRQAVNLTRSPRTCEISPAWRPAAR